MVSDENQTTDLQLSVAIVYGNVTTPSGEAVTDAPVNFNIISKDSCETNLPKKSNLWMAGSAYTNADGFYKITGKYIHIPEETVYVVMEAMPPEELDAFDTTYVWGDSVTFRHDSLTPPIDSVKINIVLSEK